MVFRMQGVSGKSGSSISKSNPYPCCVLKVSLRFEVQPFQQRLSLLSTTYARHRCRSMPSEKFRYNKPTQLNRMKLSQVCSLALVGSASAFVSNSRNSNVAQLAESKADLESMAGELNPIVKFWDPLKLAEADFWQTGNEATVGWLRHSEIKHGRVAMAAFVGYCVQSNWVFPYPLTLSGTPHPSTDLSPPEQWMALPTESKYQILAFIGFLEVFSEATGSMGLEPHYMAGGTPGKYPEFEGQIPHFVLFGKLWDPLGNVSKRTSERNSKGLQAELNNGRLARK